MVGGRKSRQRVGQGVGLGAIAAIVLHLWLGLSSPALATLGSAGWAQEMADQAVVLDGRPLFEVSQSGELTAEERAATIQREVEDLATHQEQVQVTVEVRRGVPVILVNDRYLMSVTQADAELGRGGSPQAQAERWAGVLQNALAQAQQERRAGFLLNALVYAIVAIVLAGVIHWLTGRLWHRTLRPTITSLAFARDAEGHPLMGVNWLLGASLFLVRAGVWLGAALYITNLLPLTREIAYLITSGLTDGLLARSLTLGDRNYSVLDLLILFVLLLGLVIVASAATNMLRSRILHITGINRGAQEAIAALSKYTLIFLGAIVILQIWGIDLSSLTLIASALGVGIGLGMQNIAKDFISGLIMVFERPIQVGDFIDFGEFGGGTIERIGARSTEIRTLDHISIIVPNSRFLEQEVINWSHGNPVSRIRLPVGVAYGTEPQRVKTALLEACKHNAQILRNPAPQVFFVGFGDSALNFELLVWIAQPNLQIIIKSDLYFAIEASLRKYEIEIPFPQRDVHIHTNGLPIEMQMLPPEKETGSSS